MACVVLKRISVRETFVPTRSISLSDAILKLNSAIARGGPQQEYVPWRTVAESSFRISALRYLMDAAFTACGMTNCSRPAYPF